MANVAVFVVVHNIDRLPELLESWERAGVRGGTVMESTGIHYLRSGGCPDDLPLIPSLDNFFRGCGESQRTCFTVVPEEQVDVVITATESAIGKLQEPDTGILFVLPVLRVVGLNETDTRS